MPDYPYSKEINSLGDHIRKRRIDLRLEQKKIAKIIGVDKCTIANWENNRFKPTIEFMPKIFEFLGYVPEDLFKAENLAEKLLYYRQIHGITQRELAKRVGVDPSSIMDWENEKHKPSKKTMGRLENFINSIS